MTYSFTSAETDLIVSLCRAHRINMQGHIQAIEQMGALAEVADPGRAHCEREIDLCTRVLTALGVPHDG